MAIAIRQEDTPAGNSASATSITSNALPSAAAIGSVILVAVAYGSNTDVLTSVVDSASQTYTRIGQTVDATDNSCIAVYIFTNNASATALTATATWSVSVAERNIHMVEISGAKNQAADTSNFPARIVTPGTGANAISIALTSGAQPALIWGVVVPVVGSGSLAAGTGFTGTVSFQSGAGFASSVFESKRVTATGSNPCTWTDSTNGGASTYLGVAVILDEQASGASIAWVI